MSRPIIELGDVTPHNVKQLMVINTVVFPVAYNDKFYNDVLARSKVLSKLAYYNDIVVGAVCTRVERYENRRHLNIMTLGCLGPYRRLGIGTALIQHVLRFVERDGSFDMIFLHVQVNNASAIKFYKRFGFDIVQTKVQYYKFLDPPDAYMMQKIVIRKKKRSDTITDADSTVVVNENPGPSSDTNVATGDDPKDVNDGPHLEPFNRSENNEDAVQTNEGVGRSTDDAAQSNGDAAQSTNDAVQSNGDAAQNNEDTGKLNMEMK